MTVFCQDWFWYYAQLTNKVTLLSCVWYFSSSTIFKWRISRHLLWWLPSDNWLPYPALKYMALWITWGDEEPQWWQEKRCLLEGQMERRTVDIVWINYLAVVAPLLITCCCKILCWKVALTFSVVQNSINNLAWSIFGKSQCVIFQVYIFNLDVHAEFYMFVLQFSLQSFLLNRKLVHVQLCGSHSQGGDLLLMLHSALLRNWTKV